MKKALSFVLLTAAVLYLSGCTKKQEALEQMQEPMSIEALSVANQAPAQPAAPEMKTEARTQAAASAPVVAVEIKTETITGASIEKPTTQEIQTALKNAGYYTGAIDGKKGPMTKKAIENFQKANSLKADGKVGPKTWDALNKYLTNQAPGSIPTTKKQ